MRKGQITGIILAASGALLLAACSATQATTQPKAADAPAANIKVAVAETRSVPVEIATIGSVEPINTIVVKSQIGGILTGVFFTEGTVVKKGEKLFEIDPRPYQEAIRHAEATLARDKALLAQAEANLARAQAQEAHYGKQADRYEKLAEQGIFSREQADQAGVEARARRTAVRAELAAIESAKAAIRADESAVDEARLNLSYCTITSPIDGRTGRIAVKQGNLIKANDVELVTIHQTQPVYVSFAVTEQYLAVVRARLGRLGVRAVIPGDATPAEGQVTFLDNMVDRTTGTIRLRGTFRNADARLWPGQFVDVRMRLEERPNAVVVPAVAMQTGQPGTYVYVVKPDNTVELRVVKPGPQVNQLLSLETGLAAGETVVIEGHLRLAPGARVRVAP